MRRLVSTCILSAFTLVGAQAQSVISAHSGVVHYVEGDVFVQDKPVDMKFGHFADVRENEIVRTEEGRAEVLLTPGSFLRLAENTSVKMISTHLSDTRFELLKGQILVESVDSTKDSASASIKGNAITVLYEGNATSILKPGLYEFSSSPARLRVFEGEAVVKSSTGELTLKHGKETPLEGTLTAEKFDAKESDDLVRWSSRRSGYLASANVTAARTLNNGTGGGLWNSYMGSGYGYGGWAWNSMFGMFTYVPFGGYGFSPFGYEYYSPWTVGYAPIGGYYIGGGRYYNGGSSGLGFAGSGSGLTSGISRQTGTFSSGQSFSRTSLGGVSHGVSGSGESGFGGGGRGSSAAAASNAANSGFSAPSSGRSGGGASLGGGGGGGRGSSGGRSR